MENQALWEFFNQHGLWVVFGVMALEGLNLTGIPAIVILPILGAITQQSDWKVGSVVGVVLLGSMVGNVIYYEAVYLIGPKVYDYFYNKFKRLRKSLDKANELAKKYGKKACCIGRLIPGVRTVISLIAGTFRVGLVDFVLYSAVGIFVWNVVLFSLGYLFGLSF